jgi:CubicO group peptidase (beta-lactamase class C family)
MGLAGGALMASQPVFAITPGRDSDRDRASDAPGASESPADAQFEEMCRLIEAKMAEYRTTGVAFALSRGGVRQLRGFGLTSVDNPQPVTPDTVFPIASISKTVAGTALMRLHDQGLLDVEAPVQTYLPDFGLGDPSAAAEVRIWHLMTHTPGWEGQLGTPDRGPATFENFIETLSDLPQLARPGEVWSYHNAGWGVAGRILEVVTGKTIHSALHDLVFEPLALDRSFSRTGEAMSYRFAQPHGFADGRTVVNRPFELPANVTAGGCAMSVENMIRYAEFHLGDGTAESGERLMSSASLDAMRTRRIQKNSSTDEMGLGWHLRTLDGVLTAQHGGTLSGHSLHVQLVPERDLCFAILTNHREGWKLNEDVASVILDEYEGLSLAPGQQTGGNRGGDERMWYHAEPLAVQPALGEYVGTYQRPPVGEVVVREEGQGLVVDTGGDSCSLVFWAPDMAYASAEGSTPGPWQIFRGMAFEFIRDDSGQVTWIRVDGRIARKEGR